MRVHITMTAVALTGFVVLGAAAMAQTGNSGSMGGSSGTGGSGSSAGTGTTSGPAAGGTTAPQTGPGAGGAAGVAGPPGNKNGPPQKSGSSNEQK